MADWNLLRISFPRQRPQPCTGGTTRNEGQYFLHEGAPCGSGNHRGLYCSQPVSKTGSRPVVGVKHDMQMRQVPAHLINIVKSDHMQRRAPSDARELVRAMQVADDATVGSAPTRALTLTPVLLLDEGRNFVRVADYELVGAGHSSSISPAGIWTPDHPVLPLNVITSVCCPGPRMVLVLFRSKSGSLGKTTALTKETVRIFAGLACEPPHRSRSGARPCLSFDQSSGAARDADDYTVGAPCDGRAVAARAIATCNNSR